MGQKLRCLNKYQESEDEKGTIPNSTTKSINNPKFFSKRNTKTNSSRNTDDDIKSLKSVDTEKSVNQSSKSRESLITGNWTINSKKTVNIFKKFNPSQSELAESRSIGTKAINSLKEIFENEHTRIFEKKIFINQDIFTLLNQCVKSIRLLSNSEHLLNENLIISSLIRNLNESFEALKKETGANWILKAYMYMYIIYKLDKLDNLNTSLFDSLVLYIKICNIGYKYGAVVLEFNEKMSKNFEMLLKCAYKFFIDQNILAIITNDELQKKLNKIDENNIVKINCIISSIFGNKSPILQPSPHQYISVKYLAHSVKYDPNRDIPCTLCGFVVKFGDTFYISFKISNQLKKAHFFCSSCETKNSFKKEILEKTKNQLIVKIEQKNFTTGNNKREITLINRLEEGSEKAKTFSTNLQSNLELHSSIALYAYQMSEQQVGIYYDNLYRLTSLQESDFKNYLKLLLDFYKSFYQISKPSFNPTIKFKDDLLISLPIEPDIVNNKTHGNNTPEKLIKLLQRLNTLSSDPKPNEIVNQIDGCIIKYLMNDSNINEDLICLLSTCSDDYRALPILSYLNSLYKLIKSNEDNKENKLKEAITNLNAYLDFYVISQTIDNIINPVNKDKN